MSRPGHRGHGGCFSCSRGTGSLETTLLSAPHKSCNLAVLMSNSSGWVFIHFLVHSTHSFVQPVFSEALLCARFSAQVLSQAPCPGSPGPEGRLVTIGEHVEYARQQEGAERL